MRGVSLNVGEFSREKIEARALATGSDDELLQPRPLGELVQTLESAPTPEAQTGMRSLRGLAEWLPAGLHAAVAPLEMGQQTLAFAVACDIAARSGRVLYFSLDLEPRALLGAVRIRKLGDLDWPSLPELARLPIAFIDKPAVGLADVQSVLEREPALRLVVIDSFERLVPPHRVDAVHFGRWGVAMGLAELARQRDLPIFVTGVTRACCAACGASSPDSFPGLAADVTGLEHEAHYVWKLDRESYWFADGRPELTIAVDGRDGTKLKAEIGFEPCGLSS